MIKIFHYIVIRLRQKDLMDLLDLKIIIIAFYYSTYLDCNVFLSVVMI